MFDDRYPTRRATLQAIGGIVTVSGLTGCQQRPEPDRESPVSDGDISSIGYWLRDVDNYEYSEDKTDQDEVTIEVGVENGGEPVGFGPPAIEVEAGTKIIWEWTGEGGEHRISSEAGPPFRSELTDEAGHTFEWMYETGMNVRYYCAEHRDDGMKGVIEPP